MMYDYFDGIKDGVEFLIALGSIIGLLGLILGIIGILFTGRFQRFKMIGVLAFSIILLTICGLHTGLKYFGIWL